MEGFVDKIDDNKYLGKWETILTDGRTHLPKHITFHDAAAISARFAVIFKHFASNNGSGGISSMSTMPDQSIIVTGSPANKLMVLGMKTAANFVGGHNRSLTPCMYAHSLNQFFFRVLFQLAEWDDWWKDEHYDLQIGQHWNRICGEVCFFFKHKSKAFVNIQEFEEASNLLKDLKEKREGLAAKFRDLLKTKTAEDPMGKILHEVAQLEEPSKTPVADLVEV